MSSYNSLEVQESSAFVESPIGPIMVVAGRRGIKKIELKSSARKKRSQNLENPHLKKCAKELKEYFRGLRQDFSFELDPEGTEFQKKVWRQTRRLSYGRVASYREIAKKIGKPRAARAVGQALGKNPVLLAVPCHRVLNSAHKLNGFSAGIANKEWLLEFEGASFRD